MIILIKYRKNNKRFINYMNLLYYYTKLNYYFIKSKIIL